MENHEDRAYLEIKERIKEEREAQWESELQTYAEMRKNAREIGEELRQRIRKSNHGLLKIIGLEAIPIAMGASLAGIGRASGANWLPVAPIAMDLMYNAEGYISPRGLWMLIKYGIGVSLPYADKIYLALLERGGM